VRAVDVNVLVYAHRVDSHRHREYQRWLEDARRGDEPLGLSDVVLSGFIRVVTHPRVFQEPSTLEMSLRFVDLLKSSPSATPLSPGDRHWRLFSTLCQQAGARGNQIPDAFLAALALEAGATWVTTDRGFARFPGLTWAHPLD
jgi:toxin-antitoxin system PIN domain toxin